METTLGAGFCELPGGGVEDELELAPPQPPSRKLEMKQTARRPAVRPWTGLRSTGYPIGTSSQQERTVGPILGARRQYSTGRLLKQREYTGGMVTTGTIFGGKATRQGEG